jgi:predicted metal-binding membrane protein
MQAARVAWYAVTRLPYPLLAASAVGWTLLAVAESVPSLPALCVSPATAEGAIARLSAAFSATAPSIVLLASAVMLLAMMPPLLAPPLLHVWRRSLARRRVRAVALFVLGYAVVWLGAELVLVSGWLLLGGIAPATGPAPFAIAALVALAWQATPLKQISLNRCHGRPPLAAFGLRAEADALRYGASHGLWCVGACWALMLLPLAASGPLHWTMMLGVMLISVVERVRAPQPARWGAAWLHLPSPLRTPSGPMGTTA